MGHRDQKVSRGRQGERYRMVKRRETERERLRAREREIENARERERELNDGEQKRVI